MFALLGITPQELVAQLLVGLINGSFYAILSLGLAIILAFSTLLILHMVRNTPWVRFLPGLV